LNKDNTDSSVRYNFSLEPLNNILLANLCGQFDEHLRQLEQRFSVEIKNRGHHFQIIGVDQDTVQGVAAVLKQLYASAAEEPLNPERVHLFSQASEMEEAVTKQKTPPLDQDESVTTETIEIEEDEGISIRTRRGMIRGRGVNQKTYLHNILTNDINFGVGPAGTGKTYLAVACAVEALEREEIRRILLVRPAVEAGERLGFLPGDLSQKVDPYLRPLYDALYDMLGVEKVTKLIERGTIEIAPLAYMRGRTLNHSFIILDEAQNTTSEQMKMFLTRIGFGSTAVITGDVTQIDLPRDKQSGLRHVLNILQEVEGISFTFFNAKDVVRHPIVARIIDAYSAADEANKEGENARHR